MTGWLEVKNWREHQHYGKRRPPWIKLHRALLDDFAFASLPDAAKGQLASLWLLAASEDGKLPDDPAYLARRINATEPLHLQLFIGLGLLIPTEVASVPMQPIASVPMQSTLEQDRGRVETETEAEAEAEEEATAPLVADATREKLPPQYREDYDGLLRASTHPPAFQKEVAQLLTRTHPREQRATVADVGQGCREVALKGVRPGALASFVTQIVKGRMEKERTASAKREASANDKRKRDENAPRRGGPLTPLADILAQQGIRKGAA